MGAIANAWMAASRRQKATIVVALLIAVAAVGSLTAPSGDTHVAQAQPTATATPTRSPASATPSPAATESVIETPTFSQAAITVPTPVPTPVPSTTRPTPKPTPNPTPRPTPKPTPKPTLTLTFSSLTSPVARGSLATAKVNTKPGAYCTIVVVYKSGPSTAAGLSPHTANASGLASWTWKVGTRTTLGSWPVTVTCSAQGLKKSVTKYLQVV
jgi:outer membrane biosynthesis protein TonB